MSEHKPARYDAFRRRAERLIDSPHRIQKLLGQAGRKLANNGSKGVLEARDELQTAISLLTAWLKRDYTDVSTKTLISLVAAVLYFVVPIDVIPDFLLGWGFIDDMAVIAYSFGQIREEITRYSEWVQKQNSDDPD